MFGLTGNNPANDPDKKPIKSHSKFVPNYSLYSGMLYGRYNPHFAMEVVPDDQKVSLRCNTDVDTLNLKAPLMFPVKMFKDYFLVPLRAILPNNADLLVTNPLTGQDVVPENVNAGFNPSSLAAYLTNAFTPTNRGLRRVCENSGGTFTANGDWYAKFLAAFFATSQTLNMFASLGGMLHTLGFNVENWLVPDIRDPQSNKLVTYDEVVDRVITIIKNEVEEFTVNFIELDPANPGSAMTGNSITVSVGDDVAEDVPGAYRIGFRTFLRYVYEEVRPVARVENVVCRAGSGATRTTFKWSDIIPSISPDSFFYFNITGPTTVTTYADHLFINIQRLVAYQIVNAQFYTNDGVDYVYNASLYHENQYSLLQVALGTAANVFSQAYALYYLNGVQMRYDSCSAMLLNRMFTYFSNTNNLDWQNVTGRGDGFLPRPGVFVMYLANIFGYQRALKYRDYFVGSKTRPLAVGNVDIQVNANVVNVVDVTRNIMRQRFLNQVNRLGRSLKEYSRGIFGVTPMPDPHEPILLASTCDVIGASETDSTDPVANLSIGNTTSSKMRNSSNRFCLEVDIVENGILIGITHFDAVRPYVNVTDRHFFHVDRFDMFNPFMQNVGDQAVTGDELVPGYHVWQHGHNFGYQLRYAEYKQRVDRAVGPFGAGYLPGYAFPMKYYQYKETGSQRLEQNPDFIRTRCEDFDQFYSVLPLYSQAGYFHFICRSDFQVSALRPMEAAPTIL